MPTACIWCPWCIDLETGKTHVIPDKPVHQLWFDDDTYMATRQYYDGSKIEMETSRIQRFTPNGECIETLGGIGNHIDGSPDRSYFVGDRAYPGYPADIFLYRRGETTPNCYIWWAKLPKLYLEASDSSKSNLLTRWKKNLL